jgi:hypothetical protein
MLIALLFFGCDEPDPIEPPDAGADAGFIDAGHDAGSPDAFELDASDLDGGDRDAGTMDSGAGFEVAIVFGPAPVTPARQVHVRAEDGTGRSVETTTGLDGIARLDLEGLGTPSNLTAAAPGFSAVSILGADGPIAGPIRLDALSPPSGFAEYEISGSIAGKASPNHLVQIDAWELYTASTTDSSYSTRFILTTPDLPIMLVALELDPNGDPINAAVSPALPRTAAPVQAHLTFPSPGLAPLRTNVSIDLAAGGLVSEGALPAASNLFVGKFHPAEEGAYVLVGTAKVVATSTPAWTITTFGGGLEPDLASVSLDFPSGLRVNAFQHGFGAPAELAVGPVDRFLLVGSSLSDVTLSWSATGYDAVSLNVGESPSEIPRWRIFARLDRAQIRGLPSLPTAVRGIDIGIPEDDTISVGATLVVMHAGSPWSVRTSNSGQPEYRVTVGSTYVSMSSRF